MADRKISQIAGGANPSPALTDLIEVETGAGTSYNQTANALATLYQTAFGAGGALPLAGYGTVTSVAMTTPSWLSVGGSPVTTTGTLGVIATPAQAAANVLATPPTAAGIVNLRALAVQHLAGAGATSSAIGAVQLAGDLGAGSAAAPLVVAWRGKALDPTTMGSPAAGNIPAWNGSAWAAQAPSFTVTAATLLLGTTDASYLQFETNSLVRWLVHPSTGNFEDGSGNGGNAQIMWNAGSGGSAIGFPIYSFLGQPTTGLGEGATNAPSLWANGSEVLRLSAGRFLGRTTAAGVATTTQLPNDGDYAVHKNSAASTVMLAYNDGGTIKSVQLT